MSRTVSRFTQAVMAAILLLGVFGLCACTSKPELGSASFVGEWHSSAGGSFTLSADSSFTYREYPLQVYVPDEFSTAGSGNGSWDFVPASDDDGEHLNLNFAGNFYGELFPDQSGPTLRLYFWIGPDFGSRYWFDRNA
jgi:hypothetical protein